MLVCLTSNTQAVWPGTQLTVNTANVFNCQPVRNLTIQQFHDISNSILKTAYLTSTAYFAIMQTSNTTLERRFAPLSQDTLLSTISNLLKSMSKFSYYLLLSAPRDFNTTVSTVA
jgi:hypothetical protein